MSSSPTRSVTSAFLVEVKEPCSGLNLPHGQCVLVDVMDEGAEEFCSRIRERLVGALTLTCGDRSVAEELAQDALVRVWERWRDVSQMESPEGWTFRTAFNLAASWHRRRGAERRANRRAISESPTPPARDVDEARAVREAVQRLPERQRAVVVTRFYLGYDVAGTAALLRCAPGTVKAATHQAIVNLRSAGLEVGSDAEVSP